MNNDIIQEAGDIAAEMLHAANSELPIVKVSYDGYQVNKAKVISFQTFRDNQAIKTL